jgi:hypothetical protein
MKRYGFVLAAIVGIALLAVLVPVFDTAQPRGLVITRRKARAVADEAARKLRIDPGLSYAVMVWSPSELLEQELAGDPARRRKADEDPVLSALLGSYLVTYFRPGLEKRPEYGFVFVGKKGEVVSVLRRARAEEAGAAPSPESLRHVLEDRLGAVSPSASRRRSSTRATGSSSTATASSRRWTTMASRSGSSASREFSWRRGPGARARSSGRSWNP